MSHTHYKQISYEERVIIAHEVKRVEDRVKQISISQIAKDLGRNRSTVYRELCRNGIKPDNKTTRVNKPSPDGRHFRGTERSQAIVESKHRYDLRTKRFLKHSKYRYTADTAQRLQKNRKSAAMKSCHPLKIETNKELELYVEERLKLRWSPEQISIRLAYEKSLLQISHTAVYRYVYRNGALINCLRRKGRRHGKKRGQNVYNRTNREKHSIHDRPIIVDKLERVGDLEGDTIVGKNKSDRLLTHNDRLTGLVSIGLVKHFSAYDIVKQTEKDIRRVFGGSSKRGNDNSDDDGNNNLIKTITYDNGAEFTFWKETERRIGATVYFADPYTPSQRGRNENCNGLIRDFLPKGTDFSKLTETDIMRIEFLLNNRPRKRLGGKTPQEAYVAVNELT